MTGNFIFSEDRAETIVSHLEKVQWAVRPDAITADRAILFPELDVNLDDIGLDEVQRVISSLRPGKAPGIDNCSPAFFKALASTPEGLERIRQLCQLCWEYKDLPQDWQIAQANAIFKKGDPSDYNNYSDTKY